MQLKDARWYERLSTLLLLVSVAGVGIYPQWLYQLIFDSLAPIAQKLAQHYNTCRLTEYKDI